MHDTIARLRDAINAHDAEVMAALFTHEYRSEQPAHPSRGFAGSDQVHANWSRMFTGIPDLVVEVRADAADGTTAWTEWEWRGHYRDGTPFLERGVIIFRLREDGAIDSARLYMEPVEEGGAGIDEVVRDLARVPE